MNAARFVTLSTAVTMMIGAISPIAQAQGKSRNEVNQELVQARHDGVIPADKTQYPLDSNTVSQNRQTHAAARHKGEKTPSIDHHDSTVAKK